MAPAATEAIGLRENATLMDWGHFCFFLLAANLSPANSTHTQTGNNIALGVFHFSLLVFSLFPFFFSGTRGHPAELAVSL